jgi:NAD(P)-dependent dehydrogenase (short-subunit alcohol dehydrogenase family)/uncharacterized protein YndB with AHSA1/START domain
MSQQAGGNSHSVRGQVAVVTGGGRGIGRAIALALAAAGAEVAVLARSRSELEQTVVQIEDAGGHARAFTADVSDVDSVAGATAAVAGTLGPVDILVNNAGTLGPIGPFGDTDPAKWWRTLEVNLFGPMLCTRAVLPAMIARRCGRIINIASSVVPLAYCSSYVTSKTALTRFTETVAAEVRSCGVRMFTLAPGTVRTRMSEYSLNSPEGQAWLPWFGRIFEQGLDVPPERPAQFVLALASGRADELTGRYFFVTDDLDALLRNASVIERDQLHSLRVKRLDDGAAAAALASIHAAGAGPGSLTLRLEQEFAASTAEVFGAWVNPAAVRRWFVHGAPVHWKDGPALDARPGGRYALSVANDERPADVFSFQGVYREVESPRRLTLSWGWQHLPIEGMSGPGETEISLEFFPQAGSTRMVLTQRGLPDEAAREAHRKGWMRCFDGIREVLASPVLPV